MERNLFISKARKKLLTLRLRPIRVFCFHHVSDEFEPEKMWECDWTQTEVFKNRILELKERYVFVSLTEAYNHIANDRFRIKNYAVLTADDGWASVKSIIPWLAEQGIPVTLFLNPLYMDGMHCQSRVTEEFLTREEVIELTTRYGAYITIASHGWSHKRCSNMSDDEFEDNVQTSESELSSLPGKIPFFAFPFGSYSRSNLTQLKEYQLLPVLMDGENNCQDTTCIHRENLCEK